MFDVMLPASLGVAGSHTAPAQPPLACIIVQPGSALQVRPTPHISPAAAQHLLGGPLLYSVLASSGFPATARPLLGSFTAARAATAASSRHFAARVSLASTLHATRFTSSFSAASVQPSSSALTSPAASPQLLVRRSAARGPAAQLTSSCSRSWSCGPACRTSGWPC